VKSDLAQQDNNIKVNIEDYRQQREKYFTLQCFDSLAESD